MKPENKTVNVNSKSRIDFDCHIEVNHKTGYYCGDTKIHQTVTEKVVGRNSSLPLSPSYLLITTNKS